MARLFDSDVDGEIGLNEAHHIDFIEKIKTSDLPPHILSFDEDDPCLLFRNISTLSGLVTGRRCWVVNADQHAAVIQLDGGKTSAPKDYDGKSVT
jgi:hypothetical protein